jgi:Protein-tyrosine-phosphatase
MQKLKAAYICVHNSCRSQMAEAITRELASDAIQCWSGGTEIKDHIDKGAVNIIKKFYGVDMEQLQYPKLLADIPEVDIVITMGCNVTCPSLPAAAHADWGLDDPTGGTEKEYERIAKIIEEKVMDLREAALNRAE